MRTRRIGSLEVTVVGLGCNNFGGRLDYDGSAAVVHGALDAGITFFDTADIYGGHPQRGVPRSRPGHTPSRRRARHQVRHAGRRRAQRGETRLRAQRPRGEPASPRYRPRRPLPVARPGSRDAHRGHARSPRTSASGPARRARSAARTSPWRSYARRDGAVPDGAARFVSVQNEFSLLRRKAEGDVLPECERAGLSFLPYFPLASGVLTGKYRRGERTSRRHPVVGSEGRTRARWPTTELAVVDRLTRIRRRATDGAWSSSPSPGSRRTARGVGDRRGHLGRTGPRQCRRSRLGARPRRPGWRSTPCSRPRRSHGAAPPLRPRDIATGAQSPVEAMTRPECTASTSRA